MDVFFRLDCYKKTQDIYTWYLSMKFCWGHRGKEELFVESSTKSTYLRLTTLFGLLFLIFSLVFYIFNSSVEKQGTPIEIMLFGDSLIERTNNDFDIAKLIDYSLSLDNPGFEITVTTSGKGGDTIKRLKDRLDRDVLERSGGSLPPPDAIIMYWDSDAR